MDNQQRLKLRNTARILHWVSLLIIGLVLIGGLAIRTVEPAFVRIYGEKPLRHASGAVVEALSDFYRDRRDGLTSFLPPADPDAILKWGKKVEEYFDQPAAVFVREGRHTTWINIPDEFENAAAKVPELFGRGTSSAAQGSVDTLGSFERRRTRVDTSGTGYMVSVVGPAADSLRWGAVVRSEDTWRPFFKRLKDGASAPQINRTSHQLNQILQVENALQQPTSRTGLRAFLHSELLYETPGLDTTNYVYPVDLSGDMRFEYYLSDEDQSAMNYFSSQGLSWLKVVVLVFFGIVVHLFWRWIRALTNQGA